jgi:HlyD family secretion protein
MIQEPEAGLPLEVVRHGAPERKRGWFRFRKRYLLVLLIPVFMFTGAVLGLYFQPPGLQKFYELSGLQPGAGSDSPIVLPPKSSCLRRWSRPCFPRTSWDWPG